MLQAQLAPLRCYLQHVYTNNLENFILEMISKNSKVIFIKENEVMIPRPSDKAVDTTVSVDYKERQPGCCSRCIQRIQVSMYSL